MMLPVDRRSVYLWRCLVGGAFVALLFASVFLPTFRGISPASGEAAIKPSKKWGMFFNTVGDVRIDITESGVAVRVDVPREFLPGRDENDTSFVFSDISTDYYYYRVTDQAKHYPYNENAPYSIEIWNPPQYLSPACTGQFYNFTPPKFVLLEELNAPGVSGIYNFSVFVTKKLGTDRWGQLFADFSATPTKVLQVPVSMREEPGSITGYIWDIGAGPAGIPITTQGVV